MAGGAVSWSSKRQPTVAKSTTKAEYMALSQAAQQATVAQKTAPMFAYYVKTHVLLNADII